MRGKARTSAPSPPTCRFGAIDLAEAGGPPPGGGGRDLGEPRSGQPSAEVRTSVDVGSTLGASRSEGRPSGERHPFFRGPDLAETGGPPTVRRGRDLDESRDAPSSAEVRTSTNVGSTGRASRFEPRTTGQRHLFCEVPTFPPDQGRQAREGTPTAPTPREPPWRGPSRRRRQACPSRSPPLLRSASGLIATSPPSPGNRATSTSSSGRSSTSFAHSRTRDTPAPSASCRPSPAPAR